MPQHTLIGHDVLHTHDVNHLLSFVFHNFCRNVKEQIRPVVYVLEACVATKRGNLRCQREPPVDGCVAKLLSAHPCCRHYHFYSIRVDADSLGGNDGIQRKLVVVDVNLLQRSRVVAAFKHLSDVRHGHGSSLNFDNRQIVVQVGEGILAFV